MSIDTVESREQILKLRDKVLQAEQERISGVETINVSEARKGLRERITNKQTVYTKLFY